MTGVYQYVKDCAMNALYYGECPLYLRFWVSKSIFSYHPINTVIRDFSDKWGGGFGLIFQKQDKKLNFHVKNKITQKYNNR